MSIEHDQGNRAQLAEAESTFAGDSRSAGDFRKSKPQHRDWRSTIIDSQSVDAPHGREGGLSFDARWLRYLFFAIPMLLTLVYLFGFAADRYVTESKITVTQVAGAESGNADVGNILIPRYAQSLDDLRYLREYILSLDMLLTLDQSLDLRSAFNLAERDFLYRLSDDAGQETFLAYYRSRVDVSVDTSASMLTVVTEAFTPELARNLNQTILFESEKFINHLSQASADEHLGYVMQAMERSREELDAARLAMRTLQNHYGTLDPIAQADAASSLIADLEAKSVQLQAELGQARSYLSESSSQVVMIKSTLASLKRQIGVERAKLAGSSEQKMSDVMVRYLDAKAQVEFSADMYRLSLTALERARTEAVRKLKSIAVIVGPQLAEEPEQPQPFRTLGALMLILIFLYGFLKLVWAVVEDHADVSV